MHQFGCSLAIFGSGHFSFSWRPRLRLTLHQGTVFREMEIAENYVGSLRDTESPSMPFSVACITSSMLPITVRPEVSKGEYAPRGSCFDTSARTVLERGHEWYLGDFHSLTSLLNSLLYICGVSTKYPWAAGRYANRNIAWGVREHAMCGCSSGMALHGGVRPYATEEPRR